MLQLHNLEKLNSMVAFSLDNDLERLKSILNDQVKTKEKYHYVILETTNDKIIYEKKKG
jgi:hypothetical protein